MFQHPAKGQPGGKINVCLRQLFQTQLHGNGGQSEDVVILVQGFLSGIGLVTLTDQVVAALVDQHIFGEQGFCVVGGQAGTETEICRFHVSVPGIHTDDFDVVDCFHLIFLSKF